MTDAGIMTSAIQITMAFPFGYVEALYGILFSWFVSLLANTFANSHRSVAKTEFVSPQAVFIVQTVDITFYWSGFGHPTNKAQKEGRKK